VARTALTQSISKSNVLRSTLTVFLCSDDRTWAGFSLLVSLCF